MTSLPRLPSLTVATVLAVTAATLFAQTAPAPSAAVRDEAVKLEAVTVTGSNIKRIETERALPMTTVKAEQLEIYDPGQPSDLLAMLPMAAGLPGNEAALATQNARGDNANISFRGLASGNTLILLNGRRIAPHPISWNENGIPALSVNVNQLPNRGIERVDVLRDGASSIYGADAVAGVVNYVMHRRFRGTELSLRFGTTEYGDGTEYRASLTHGLDFANKKGRLTFTADWYDREGTFLRDRPFAADGDQVARAPAPWNVYTDTSFFKRTTTSAYGQFNTVVSPGRDQYGAFLVTNQRPAGIPTTFFTTTGGFFLMPTTGSGQPGIASAAPARAATGPGKEYYWNLNDARSLQPQSTRKNVFLGGEYDLRPRLTAFADFNYYRARSIIDRDPDIYQSSVNGSLFIPTTNPYNPFGDRFWSPTGAANSDGTPRLTGTPSAVNVVNHRFWDFGSRIDTVTNSAYRGLLGLRGKFGATWSWESAVMHAEGRANENEPIQRTSLTQAAALLTDPARALNAFGRSYAVRGGALVDTGPFRNAPSVKQSTYGVFERDGMTRLRSIDFNASGEIWSLWGGNTISLALGGEVRREDFSDVRAAFAGLNPAGSGLDPTRSDVVSASSVPDTFAHREAYSGYAEVLLPLAGRNFTLPLVQSFELSAAARTEHYSDFGHTLSPKFGLTWKPVDWIMVRASHSKGFRPPSLPALYRGSFIGTALNSQDTYRSTVTQLLTDQGLNRINRVEGNPKLQPEKSNGISSGLVVDVPGVRGLSLTVDYYEIRHRDILGSSGSINDDRDALVAATQAALAAGQSINAIDLGAGTGRYQGDGSVVRLPVTQEDRNFFAAYNATRAPSAQRAAVGSIDFLRTTYFNKAEQFVNGFDFGLNYRFRPLSLGNFTLETNGTKLNSFFIYTTRGAVRTELMETNLAATSGASPKWRGNVQLNWRRDQWSAGLGMFYTGSFTLSGVTTSRATYEALGSPASIKPVFTNGSTLYRMVHRDTQTYNAFLSYRLRKADTRSWLRDTSVRVGVNNLLNAEPPLSDDNNTYESALFNTMAKGRMYSLTLTKTF
ncbi:MAG: TonB-dependent receptor [Verrucomicrobia bacterium]|nr:TonB-dependent receptor [Verrucomicrobiota bacterium]